MTQNDPAKKIENVQDIKIKARPSSVNPYSCEFVLEFAIESCGAYSFKTSADAEGSELAKEIFSVATVKSVVILGGTVTVIKADDSPWPPVAKEIGQAIRRAFASGKPLVAEQKKLRSPSEQEIMTKVVKILTDDVNPQVASHGGFIELIDVNEKDVYLRMGGGCQGCASSTATLKQGVEKTLRDKIPQIENIIDSTDHASGVNPYYR